METERGGVVESSLTFSYIHMEGASTPTAVSGVGALAGKLIGGSGSFIGTSNEGLISNRKPKQSGTYTS